MYATMAMIFDALASRYPCSKGAFFNPKIPVLVAQLLPGDFREIGTYKAYLVKDTGSSIMHPGVPFDHMIVTSQDAKPHLPCAVSIQSDGSVEAILDTVNETICSYRAWADELFSLNSQDCDIDTLVEHAHKLFNNPITIIDHNFKLIACTEYDAMEDELWVTTTSGKMAPLEGLDEERFVAFLDRLKRERDLLNYRVSNGRLMSSCLVCQRGSGVISVNLVCKNRAITEGDLSCLRYFADVLEGRLAANAFAWQDERKGYVALLHEAIRGNVSNPDDFETRVNELHLNLKPWFTVLVVVSRSGFLKNHHLQYVGQEIESLLSSGCPIIHERSVVIVANHSELCFTNQTKRDCVRDYLNDHDLILGVSDSQRISSPLSALYEQARLALMIGRKVSPSECEFRFNDYRAYYLFELSFRQGGWRRYMHPLIEILREYDKTAGSPLLPTLRCLSDNDGNRTVTANALGIQRNTLQYRLNKIEHLCSADLTDPETFEHIQLSFALHDYCNRR